MDVINSPVRDPNFESFNFSQLLDRATQPLATLGQGQLAIASQNNQRAFEAQQLDRRMTAEQRNRLAELSAGADIRESERQRLRGETADQAIAIAKQRHPNWNPPAGSIEDKIAAAQQLNDEDTLEGVRAAAKYPQLQKQEENAVLQKYGAVIDQYNPKDPNYATLTKLVNEQLSHDPTLTTGNFPVLGASELNALAAGKTPEEIANKFSLTSNQKLLLNAAAAARAAIVPQLQQRATQAGQAELAQIQSKYSAINQLPTDLLNSIGRNQPWLLGRAAAIVGEQPAFRGTQNLGLAVPPPPAPPKPNPTANAATGFPGAPYLAPGQSNTVSSGPGDEAINQNNAIIEKNGHMNAASAIDSLLQKAQDQKQNLLNNLKADAITAGGFAMPSAAAIDGSFAPANTRPFTPEEKRDFGKKLNQVQSSIDALTKQKQDHLDAAHSIAVPQSSSGLGNLTPQTLPQQPLTPQQQVTPQAPVQPQPPTYPQVLPPPQSGPQPGVQNPQQASDPSQANPFLHQQIQQKIYQLIGTDDPQKLQAIGQFAQTNLGISKEQGQQLLQSAIQGDPTAAQKIRQIAQQASGQSFQAPAAPSQDFSSLAQFGS